MTLQCLIKKYRALLIKVRTIADDGQLTLIDEYDVIESDDGKCVVVFDRHAVNAMLFEEIIYLVNEVSDNRLVCVDGNDHHKKCIAVRIISENKQEHFRTLVDIRSYHNGNITG